LSRDLADFLEACWRTHFNGADLDAVTFVPLFPRKQRERTYNQSHLLAAELAPRLRCPLLTRCLRRVRYTATQTHLSMDERAANVRGAFAVSDPDWVAGRNLLLVDDVMTTGATVSECARVLKEAGAGRVYVITVARG
jgi:ComF family protein